MPTVLVRANSSISQVSKISGLQPPVRGPVPVRGEFVTGPYTFQVKYSGICVTLCDEIIPV